MGSRNRKRLVFAGLAVVLAFGVAVALGAPARRDLDPTFGHRGVLVTPLGPGDSGVSAIAVQPDKKLVLVGTANYRLAVARLTKTGRLDPTFGRHGRVALKVGGAADGFAVAIQRDGKIVVAGDTVLEGTQTVEAVIARFNPDGSLDTTFGSGLGYKGVVLDDFDSAGAAATAVAIQPDGRIVVAGSRRNGPVGSAFHFAVVRYTAAGIRDISFGKAGIVDGTFGGYDSAATSLALAGRGRILVGGIAASFSSPSSLRYHGFGLARLLPDGSSDPSFAAPYGSTVASVRGGGELLAMELHKGKIVAAGGSIAKDPTGGNQPRSKFAVMRFTANGRRDPSFGRHGAVTTSFGRAGSAAAVVVLGDGKIVAVGTNQGVEFSEGVLIRYRRNGTLDKSFGRRGILGPPVKAWSSGASSATLEGGKLVAAGGGLFGPTSAGPFKALVARYRNR